MREDPLASVKIPRGEKTVMSYFTYDGKEPLFVMTQKTGSDELYVLYEVEPDGNLKKLSRGSSPIEMEKKHKVVERIR